MNGVDLKQFQFDYDQTWCAFFLNADGTIYGRYGTRAGNRDQSTTHISIPSFKKAATGKNPTRPGAVTGIQRTLTFLTVNQQRRW